MRALNPPAVTASVPGPWGVDTIGNVWCVIHRERLTAKAIGRVSKGRGTNYFDRAMEEANRRNAALKGVSMEKAKQAEIAADLIDSLRKDVLGKIERGEIPDDWNGIELRQYIVDRAKESIIERRKKIKAAIDTLRQAQGELAEARDEEQEYLDNMPEGLQSSERGEKAQEAVDALDGACDEIDNTIDSIEGAL
jgi:hypothetical protein